MGAEAGVDAGVVTAAVIGTIVSAALFWLYFDVVALVARRRLENAAPGRERNEIARASPSCAAGCATPPRRRAEGQAARRPRACTPRSSSARGAAETSASACGPGVP